MLGSSKPPPGIKPRYLWLEERATEVKKAILRYAEAGLAVPFEWVVEWNNLQKELGRSESGWT